MLTVTHKAHSTRLFRTHISVWRFPTPHELCESGLVWLPGIPEEEIAQRQDSLPPGHHVQVLRDEAPVGLALSRGYPPGVQHLMEGG